MIFKLVYVIGKEKQSMNSKINRFNNLKNMINNTREKFGNKTAFYVGGDTIESSKKISYNEFVNDIEYLGTAMIEMGLKGKRIAIISENRYEWEVAYLAVCCGTGVVVPLDKALQIDEIESLIIRSEAEAIFYSSKYNEFMQTIQKNGKSKLKYFISMDLEKNDFNKFSQKEIIQKGKELLEQGNKEFINAEINNEEMNIMLFTSGTTSKSKSVMLSHKNLCTNILDIGECFEVNETDTFLSFLPLHHTFECTVGFLYPISVGSTIVFSRGVRHIAAELKEFKITAMISVPALVEKMYDKIMKAIEEKGKMSFVKKGITLSNALLKVGIDVKKKFFKEIYQSLGGYLRIVVVGGAPFSVEKEKGFWDLGFNVLQGYGLTETSPVIAAELTKQKRIGSIGKKMPSIEVKIDNPDEKGVGELLAKGDSIMLGYYENEEANEEVFDKDGWFHTGDLARIDKDGYIFISGRKKFVIVLKNGKNVYPEEIEALIDRSDLIKESMVYGMPDDDDDVKIGVKVVYDKEYIKNKFGDINEEQIKEKIWNWVKEVNKTLPKYKYVKSLILTEEELVKTTTLKIKRNIEMEKIISSQN